MKKETFEEAAERFYQKGLKDDLGLSFHDGVSIGAKWQQERMYSEEEVLDLLFKMNSWPTIFDGEEDISEWFEEFKKK